MTLNRVLIKSGVSSPFKVSVSGVDAASAGFDNTIFDGNQSPLRLFLVGYTTVPPLGCGNISPAFIAAGASLPSVPAGTHPVVVICGRSSIQVRDINGGIPTAVGWNQTTFHQSAGAGIGSILTDTDIWGMNFTSNSTSAGCASFPNNEVHYAIFRNYR